MDLSVDMLPIAGPKLAPDTQNIGYRYRKGQEQGQSTPSRPIQQEESQLSANQSSAALEGMCLSSVVAARAVKSSESISVTNNNNCTSSNNNINNNNNNDNHNSNINKTGVDGRQNSSSILSASPVHSDALGKHTNRGEEDSCRAPPACVSPPPPGASLASPENMPHKRTTSSCLGQEEKKKRKKSATSHGHVSFHTRILKRQMHSEDRSAISIKDESNESNEDVDNTQKPKHLRETLSCCSSLSPSTQDIATDCSNVRQGRDIQGQGQSSHSSDGLSMQPEARPSAIVKIKTELPSPSQSYHSNDDSNNECSSTLSGPESSSCEGRGMSMVSPSSCPQSGETTKAKGSSVSSGESPRLVRTPSPTSHERQFHQLHQQQNLNQLQQHYGPLQSQNYHEFQHHFLGQLYPPHHKLFSPNYSNNSHSSHPPYPYPSSPHQQQHYDFLLAAKRASAAASSSPSSSSMPPSPDRHSHQHLQQQHHHHHHHHHQQLHTEHHVATGAPPVRPQQLSPKASNFSIAAILGSSCGRKTPSTTTTTANIIKITHNSNTDRHRDTEREDPRNSDRPARNCIVQTRCPLPGPRHSPYRGSPAHTEDLRHSESRPSTPTPPLTPPTPSMASPIRDCDGDAEIDVGGNDPAAIVTPQPEKEESRNFDDDSVCCKASERGEEKGETTKTKCRLETKDLWDKFHELGTEMIITKTGR
ncbi:T-box transcription factor tbx20 [Plakobranchus ocellatus]|uniref:T-box transcription factor tbx20 n=1 Tax=Plakobranchus ocellatus TaxID=259542 RepID=A0AAV3ZQ14_9GAST|nr:T-box transcription factor tbx20 [Plakobranchus ocellatus]